MAQWVTHFRAKPAATRESALTSLKTLFSSPETRIIYVLQGITRADFERSLANFNIGTIFKLNKRRFIFWDIVNYWWVPRISVIIAMATTFSAKIALEGRRKILASWPISSQLKQTLRFRSFLKWRERSLDYSVKLVVGHHASGKLNTWQAVLVDSLMTIATQSTD